MGPVGVAVRRAIASAIAGLAVVGAGLVAPGAGAASAAVVGAPVVIDDFNGGTLGTRTVTNNGPAGYSQVPGTGTVTLQGPGNTAGESSLHYSFPQPEDLTGGGTDTQFFLETSEISRTNTQSYQDAVNVTIRATDSHGTTGSYQTGISSVFAFNVVLNFNCQLNPVCFSPQPDWTQITSVEVDLFYPQNYDSTGGTTTVTINKIRTTPYGGVVPTAPYPSFSEGSPLYAPAGATVTVPVSFTSGGQPDAITDQPTTANGLRPADVSVSTSSTDTLTVTQVTGGPSSYGIVIAGMTQDQQITVDVPAGAVQDAWGNQNLDGSTTFDFKLSVPPSFTSAAGGTLTVGSSGSLPISATGTPAPTLSLLSPLPAGLSFDAGTPSGSSVTGSISGTPAPGTGGRYTLSLAATGYPPPAAQSFVLTVDEAPTLTSASTATFVAGTPGSVAITAAGYPAPQVALIGTLPSGLSFSGGVLSGDPAAGAVGTYDLTATATNGVGSPASQPFTVDVVAPPAITSPASTTFGAGRASTFTVVATGSPTPTLSEQGALPAGVGFDPLSGVLSGTPSTTEVGTYPITFTADNGTTPYVQAFTLTVATAASVHIRVAGHTIDYGSLVRVHVTAGGSAAAGTVTVFDGNASTGPLTLTNGYAAIPAPFLAPGSHSLTASFSSESPTVADATTAGPYALQVDQATTTVFLRSEHDPAHPHGTLLFLGRVLRQSLREVPTGTITVSVVGSPTPLCTITLAAGSNQGTCSAPASALGVGTYQVQATYGGDTGNLGSTSEVVTQRIG